MKFSYIDNKVSISELKKIRKYPYKKYNRYSDEKGRKYLVDEIPVPSVTTILSKTKEDDGLKKWRQRMGDAKANEIMQNAATIGTEMHYVLEQFFEGRPYFNTREEGTKPRFMAYKIMQNLTPMTEVWGNEISLAYKHEYAGSTDMVALYDGKPTIIDFKQSNKPKREEWVEDYKHQLGAYYLAHREAYGPIEQGLISICVRDLTYQKFMLSEADLQEYGDKFLARVEKFKNSSGVTA